MLGSQGGQIGPTNQKFSRGGDACGSPRSPPRSVKVSLEPDSAALDRSPREWSKPRTPGKALQTPVSVETAGAAAADLLPVEGLRGAGRSRATTGACAGPRAEACAQPGRLHCARAEPRVGPGSGARGVEDDGLLRPGGRLRRGHGTPAGGRERAPAPRLCAPRPQPALRGDPELAGGGTLGGGGAREAGPRGGWR